MKGKPMRVLSAKRQPPAPPEDRGRILYTHDIQELLGKKPDGKYVRSEWWVWNRFAPEFKRKLGQSPFWFEHDAMRWLAEQGMATNAHTGGGR